MKILLDECVPRPLGRHLEGHEVITVQEAGWASMVNGPLIANAESRFDVFLTLDKGIRYQQNLESRSLAFIVLRAPSNRLEDLLPLVPDIVAILSRIEPGEVAQLGN